MIIVGHRGARNEAPENTLEGFIHAHRNGCISFELDIQLSKDHELMVFHDRSLKRTTGVRGKLTDYTHAELRHIDARHNTPGWPQACNIPNLADLLTELPEVTHWQFEVKADSTLRLSIITHALSKLIDQFELQDRATITSSSQWLLKHLQSEYRHISKGYVAESYFIDPIKTALKYDCDYLCISQKILSQKRVEKARAKGLNISVWTVNDLDKMRELQRWGVDSIITDVPTMALQELI